MRAISVVARVMCCVALVLAMAREATAQTAASGAPAASSAAADANAAKDKEHTAKPLTVGLDHVPRCDAGRVQVWREVECCVRAAHREHGQIGLRDSGNCGGAIGCRRGCVGNVLG